MLKNNKIYKFYREVKQEALKVIWPNSKELSVLTAVVSFSVLVFSIICLVLDYSIHTLVDFLLGIGK